MYYALWIPSLTQGIPEVVEPTLNRDLKDVEQFDACRFRSVADPKTCDITLNYSLSDDSALSQIIFRCCNRTHTGFIIYQLEPDMEGDRVVDELIVEMHPSIYHLIKCHFHRHSFHDEECDTMLRAYNSKLPIDINNQSVMKKVYSDYLEQYRIKLQGALTDLSAQYKKLIELGKRDMFATSLKQAKRLKETSEQAVGEATFARSLLMMSRASVRMHIYERITMLTIDIETLSRRCSDYYTVMNNRFNNRLGLIGIWVGVAGILLTLILEVSKCSCSREDYNEEYRELKYRADSLNMENHRALEEYKRIKGIICN